MKQNRRAEALQARERRLASADTVIIPAREEGFKKVFLGENRWYEVRIGPLMIDRLKYIAAYQVAPVSAVTHVAEIEEILPYKDTGKYEIIFSGAAERISDVKPAASRMSPQGPLYCRREDLIKAGNLEDLL